MQLKRVAVIVPAEKNCGIRTYSDYLLAEFDKLVSQVLVFSNNDSLLTQMAVYDPDIIFLQHEFGIYHDQGKFSCLMSQLARWRTVVTLHTVLEHDIANDEARNDYLTRSISEASCREVIVHSPQARVTLRARGYSGTVHFIPHGCLERSQVLGPLPATKYGMYSKHSLIQFGFGGRHKGWENAIETVDLLKDDFPNIMYLGLFNCKDGDLSTEAYYRELLIKIKALGLQTKISLIKGFQSEQMLETLIRCSRAAIYLYKPPNDYWFSWGASGAVRLPLALNKPLVLGKFSQFSEFEGVAPIVKTPFEAAAVIRKIFNEPIFEQNLKAKLQHFNDNRTWARVAKWHLECVPNEDFNAL